MPAGTRSTATSPSALGAQTAVTSETGNYRFPAVPPGQYELTFELAGFSKGIVAGTETWWKNQFKDWGTDTGATLLADYNTLYFACAKGSKPGVPPG